MTFCFYPRFAEGTTILTLADAEVLANSEDTLVNVNMVDDESAEVVSYIQ